MGTPSEYPRHWLSRKAEWLGLSAVAGLAAWLLAASWRKWPDTLVDFSRELYVPWRIANGALLYRDVNDIFGPLSQYFNAALFSVFGPGLMVLVAANLAVFAAITGLIYRHFRRAWGPGAALASSAVFVSVFGFSQYITIGNYNYATPYCHEATHGVLVCLLLLGALDGWVGRPSAARSLVAGGLFGLTAVLKPEIMLAGAAVTLAAVAIRIRRGGRPAGSAAAAWAAGALLPTALFAAWFSRRVGWRAGIGMAGHVWLSAGTTGRQINERVQARFLGLDNIPRHLAEHGLATLLGLLLVGSLCALAWTAERAPRPWFRNLAAGIAAGGGLWLGCRGIAWTNIGHCLLGLTLAYGAFGFFRLALRREWGGFPEGSTLRLLIPVLAAVLMGRMVLAGRIYHYGFYQAALAGILVPAVMIGELPGLIGLAGRGRLVLAGGTLLLLAPGVAQLTALSGHLMSLKTEPVGRGRDLFYTFPQEINPTGAMVRLTSESLERRPPGGTLVVLPEGEIINYLARMPSPVAPYSFYGANTADGLEKAIVRDLDRHPPDWIVIISRDLGDYGIHSYGESPGSGRDILEWVAANYEHADYFGGNPFDPRQCGAMIMARSPAR